MRMRRACGPGVGPHPSGFLVTIGRCRYVRRYGSSWERPLDLTRIPVQACCPGIHALRRGERHLNTYRSIGSNRDSSS